MSGLHTSTEGVAVTATPRLAAAPYPRLAPGITTDDVGEAPAHEVDGPVWGAVVHHHHFAEALRPQAVDATGESGAPDS